MVVSPAEECTHACARDTCNTEQDPQNIGWTLITVHLVYIGSSYSVFLCLADLETNSALNVPHGVGYT